MCMPSLMPRSLSPLALLLGVVCACAPGKTTRSGGGAARPAEARGSTVTSKDLDRTHDETVAKSLMGRFPGVWVTQTPSGDISVRIRGATTIMGSEAPLYVVDGIAVQPGPTGALSGIRADDIATIEVLKDAASTTWYGVRGANGVIVVKTKPVIVKDGNQ